MKSWIFLPGCFSHPPCRNFHSRGEAELRKDVVDVRFHGGHFHGQLRRDLWFAGRVISGEPHPAAGEFTEIAWVDPATPPPLAFPTDALVLRELAAR